MTYRIQLPPPPPAWQAHLRMPRSSAPEPATAWRSNQQTEIHKKAFWTQTGPLHPSLSLASEGKCALPPASPPIQAPSPARCHRPSRCALPAQHRRRSYALHRRQSPLPISSQKKNLLNPDAPLQHTVEAVSKAGRNAQMLQHPIDRQLTDSPKQPMSATLISDTIRSFEWT